MIIAPAYASLCVPTTQNGTNFHRKVSRGFLLLHDSLCMAGPSCQDKVQEYAYILAARSVAYNRKVVSRGIQISRPPRCFEIPIKEHIYSVHTQQKTCHLSTTMTTFAVSVMWPLNHRQPITRRLMLTRRIQRNKQQTTNNRAQPSKSTEIKADLSLVDEYGAHGKDSCSETVSSQRSILWWIPETIGWTSCSPVNCFPAGLLKPTMAWACWLGTPVLNTYQERAILTTTWCTMLASKKSISWPVSWSLWSWSRKWSARCHSSRGVRDNEIEESEMQIV